MSWRTLWRKILAAFRLDLEAVCEQSKGLGVVDYHDYHDSVEGNPYHFAELTCKRCGKKFTI